MRRQWNLIAAFILLTSLGLVSLTAGELAQKGREIFNKQQRAVVTVHVVLKVSSGSGGSRESQQDITGTVIDPSGLTVLALSACDPTEMTRRLTPDYNIESEVTDVKILVDDAELPAEIVLRDKDLDLAYVRPKTKPATPMASVDLGKSGTALPLDEVIALNRLNKAASRAYAASAGNVAAVIQKPRTFYIPDGMSSAAFGAPVFLLDGKILGIFVRRAVGGGGSSRDNITSIILPAEDILKGAKQASEPKSDSEKSSEKSSEKKEETKK
jgi:Trypsin-like peptidase domain